jgi:hypothetical protein
MFHVPEGGRILDGPMSSSRDAGNFGAFTLPSPEPGWTLYLVCDDGADPQAGDLGGWEHVSVDARSARDGKTRTPTWKEMAFVKATCWDDADVVVQFHPAKASYVNVHPHVLHLWRHRTQTFPLPPIGLV